MWSSFPLEHHAETTPTLSWGIAEELLVGGTELTLHTTAESPQLVVWCKSLASPVKHAQFSYDAGYIASTGQYDRLVKVWRRLSFGWDDVRFDVTYLSHPSTVTNIHWRRPFHKDQTLDNVLYTFCADNILRIWAGTDPHGLQILQLWAQIDLVESIAPRGLPLKETPSIRYAFIVDGRDFTMATEHAVQAADSSQSEADHALEHLIEVANRSPEICVVLDNHGHMSAWGLENVGCKARQTSNIFNIVHTDGLQLGFQRDSSTADNHVQIYTYCNQSGGRLHILVHHFDGRIEVFESNLEHLFDPLARSNRLVLKAVWTGHSGIIKKIVRDSTGSAVVSRTNDNECIVWKHSKDSASVDLKRQSIITGREHVHRICVLEDGNYVIFLHHSRVSLWDTRSQDSVLLAECAHDVVGKPLCLLLLPSVLTQNRVAHIASVTSKMEGIVWEVRIPQVKYASKLENGYGSATVKEFCRFDLGGVDDLAYVLPVDPAGSAAVIQGFLDTFSRDVAISYTHAGLLHTWAARVDVEKGMAHWLLTSSTATGIPDPALVSGCSIRKAALIDASRTELTIWDTSGSRLEHLQKFESHETIQDLDWTSTPDNQCILAVGCRYRVLLFAQMRYDYLNKGVAWSSIHEISIRELTPQPIGDSTWLGAGNLVVGAGTQLFIYDKNIALSPPLASSLRISHRKKKDFDLFNVVTRLNGPLPVFHPQFLAQCILAGKTALVQHIILTLYKILRFRGEEEHIDNFLGIEPDMVYTNLVRYEAVCVPLQRLTYHRTSRRRQPSSSSTSMHSLWTMTMGIALRTVLPRI